MGSRSRVQRMTGLEFLGGQVTVYIFMAVASGRPQDSQSSLDRTLPRSGGRSISERASCRPSYVSWRRPASAKRRPDGRTLTLVLVATLATADGRQRCLGRSDPERE
jgi:hypothetical protein